MSFQQIVEEIMSSHHRLLRKELPAISELFDDLCNQHPGDESLNEARQIFKKVRSKVETHLQDEETILFPYGIALESGKTPAPTEMNLLDRLAEMEKEHSGCSNTLAGIEQTIKETTGQSELKDSLLAKLKIIQDDFVVHVEKENSRVHPMFIEMASYLKS